MQRFRIEVGYEHNIKPGNIVGAIANEADLDSKHIGHIAIHDDYSTVDLPAHLASNLLKVLKNTRVAGKPMNISPVGLGKAGGEQKSLRNDAKPFREKKTFGDKKPVADKKSFAEKKPFSDKKPYGEKKSYGDKKTFGDKKPFGDKPAKEKLSFRDKKADSPKKPDGTKPFRKKK